MDRLEFVFLNFSFVCSLSETVTKGGTVFDLVRFPKFRFPLSVKKIRDGGFLCTKIVHFFFCFFLCFFLRWASEPNQRANGENWPRGDSSFLFLALVGLELLGSLRESHVPACNCIRTIMAGGKDECG